MLFEPSEHEPDEYDPEGDHEPEEYDPEAELRDPDADGITIPTVSTAEDDVPADLAKTFWIVVVVVNAAILSLSLGALLLWFRGDATVGGSLLAGGVVLLALAVRRYRAFDHETPEPSGGAVSESAGDGTAERPDGDREGAETVSGTERVADSPEESPSHDENGT